MKKQIIILGITAIIADGCGGQATNNKQVNNMTEEIETVEMEPITEEERQTILHDPEIKILGKENCLKGEPSFAPGDYTMCIKIYFEDGTYQINTYQMFDDFGIYLETLYNKDGKELLRRGGGSYRKSTYDEDGILQHIEDFDWIGEEVRSKSFDFFYDKQERLILRIGYYLGVEDSRWEYAYKDNGEHTWTIYFNYNDKGKPEYKEIITYNKDGKEISDIDGIPVK